MLVIAIDIDVSITLFIRIVFDVAESLMLQGIQPYFERF